MKMESIIKYPIVTEKALRLMESNNELIFVVDNNAKKEDIKKAVESLFKAKVTRVNILRTIKGIKKAQVKFSKETPAIDIATQLGMT
jgi:ribosomal protein uL23